MWRRCQPRSRPLRVSCQHRRRTLLRCAASGGTRRASGSPRSTANLLRPPRRRCAASSPAASADRSRPPSSRRRRLPLPPASRAAPRTTELRCRHLPSLPKKHRDRLQQGFSTSGVGTPWGCLTNNPGGIKTRFREVIQKFEISVPRNVCRRFEFSSTTMAVSAIN